MHIRTSTHPLRATTSPTSVQAAALLREGIRRPSFFLPAFMKLSLGPVFIITWFGYKANSEGRADLKGTIGQYIRVLRLHGLFVLPSLARIMDCVNRMLPPVTTVNAISELMQQRAARHQSWASAAASVRNRLRLRALPSRAAETASASSSCARRKPSTSM